MGKTKIKTIDDSEKVEEPKKKKPAKKFGGADEPVPQTIQPRAQVFDSAQTRGARRGKRDELVEKLKAELGVEEAPVDTSKESPSTSLGASEPTFEVRSVEELAAKHLRGEVTDVPQAKHLGGEVKGTQAKGKKPGKPKPRSKKYQEVAKDLDKTKAYPIDEAIDLVKKLSYAKFKYGPGTLEAHINTAQTGIHGLVSLPYASGKKLRILAFGKGTPSSGGFLVGDDSTIEEIAKGKINFDLVITNPEWMPKLAKVAKVLGPRGLMPNPKNGTITDDLKQAVESFQEGKTEFKTESKAPVIHLALGKLDQASEELSSNVKTLLSTLGKSRIKKVTLSPTMGPAVRVDLASI